ncbi:MAG TPA: SRPBCC family protein, partial [Acidimicrobiales bacterium]|nr:SRPBCC family protein [Acidimicrobiales bacterium]
MSGPTPRSGSATVGLWPIEATARSSAPVEVVWPLIGEASRWKEWSFLDRSDLLRSGEPAPDGVGAIRRFTRFGVGSQEEVVAWEPPNHLGYTMLKGFPVRNYRADVTCTPDGSG